MYVMTVTWPDGRTSQTLASGWTPTECARYRAAYEAQGGTVAFGYQVWSVTS